MTFILISGKTRAGKTSVCNKLHGKIGKDENFKVCDNHPCQNGELVDFIAHYKKCRKHIVLNSASDGDDCMEELAQYLDDLAASDVYPDIIVTTIRETDIKNYQMSRMLALLGEVAKGTANLADCFAQNIVDITSFAPESLGCHSFVLRLEKDEGMDANALSRYWNSNAETVKQMIDLALDRL